MADDWGDEPTTTSAPAAASSNDDGWGSTTASTPTPATNSYSGGSQRPSWGARGGSSWGNNGSTGGDNADDNGGPPPKARVSIPAQIEIDKFPVTTSNLELKHRFGRYGRISRLVIDYRYDEGRGGRAFAWLDYEKELSAEVSIWLHADALN